ncbi:MAG: phosphate acyltransferase PlsX [Rhodospirillales bacterium]|nr:phosphate acyltransferase PlsX [Rhodospirillales bacterium]
MAESITIAIDAMGGDRAPRMVVDGLRRLREPDKDVRFLLFGQMDELLPLVRRHKKLRDRVEVRDAPDVVSNHVKPSVALRGAQNSSMRKAIDAVAIGEADGVVSAGNTGALMAMAKFVLKTLPGVDRPAIASVFPTLRGKTVLLDLGANIDCTADNLVQFAIMGEVFARKVLGLTRPTVGILNVGEEQLKGNTSVKKAAETLKNSALSLHFHGFVEGNDIAAGTVDVIVTDGFTGNIALKTAEGTAKLYAHLLRSALSSSVLARIGAIFSRPALQAMRLRVDPRQHNGAMFLGLNGVVVKSHGGTDAIGFANAMHVAVQLISDRVNEGIKQDFFCLGQTVNNNSKLAAQ